MDGSNYGRDKKGDFFVSLAGLIKTNKTAVALLMMTGFESKLYL